MDAAAASSINTYYTVAQKDAQSAGSSAEYETIGFLYENNATGAIVDYYDGDHPLINGVAQNVAGPPTESGYTLVGWWHDHPGEGGSQYSWTNGGNGIDSGNGTYFSSGDDATTDQLNVPGYVGEYNDQGAQTDNPDMEQAEEQFVFYEVTPAGSQTAKGQVANSKC